MAFRFRWRYQTWKRKRFLRKELARISALYEPQLKEAKTDDEVANVYSAINAETQVEAEELSNLEWASMASTAARLGIDVPGHPRDRITVLAKAIKDTRLRRWKTATVEVIVPILSLVVALGGLWIGSRQLPDRRAVLVLELDPNAVFLISRAPKEWLVGATLRLRNEGDSGAEHLSIELQHRPSGWTGIQTFNDVSRLDPGEVRSLLFQRDTYADPHAVLASGAHLYFAVRAKWTHRDTAKGGCQVFYVDYRQTAGTELGNTVVLADVLKQRPEGLDAPPIGSCE